MRELLAWVWILLVMVALIGAFADVLGALLERWPRIRCRWLWHRDSVIALGDRLYYRCVDCRAGSVLADVAPPHVTGMPRGGRRRRRKS